MLNKTSYLFLLLCNANYFREKNEEKEQQSLAIMLMAVVIVFVVCNLLAMVSIFLEITNIEAPIIIKVLLLLTFFLI